MVPWERRWLCEKGPNPAEGERPYKLGMRADGDALYYLCGQRLTRWRAGDDTTVPSLAVEYDWWMTGLVVDKNAAYARVDTRGIEAREHTGDIVNTDLSSGTVTTLVHRPHPGWSPAKDLPGLTDSIRWQYDQPLSVDRGFVYYLDKDAIRRVPQ